jgi:hypothetical protein
LPDDDTLAAIPVPVRLLVSADGLPVFAGIARRLGDRVGVDVATTPGRHDVYHEYAREFAETPRPLLRDVSHATTQPRISVVGGSLGRPEKRNQRGARG